MVALLREHRLVTLTGPPGVGKSRLALEAARVLESDVRDGAWLVELARAGGAERVERVVADAIDARGPIRSPVSSRAYEMLRPSSSSTRVSTR